MIIRLLYLARKLVAQYWMSPVVLTKKQCVNYVNSLLLREQLTFHHHNALHKFDLIWQNWLNTPGLAPQILVMDRLLQM